MLKAMVVGQVLPGQMLLVVETAPAPFSSATANDAERVSPGITPVDVSMIGVAGRVYMAGSTEEVLVARDEITRVLGELEGRER